MGLDLLTGISGVWGLGSLSAVCMHAVAWPTPAHNVYDIKVEARSTSLLLECSSSANQKPFSMTNSLHCECSGTPIDSLL